jgi:hypothetical protein
MIYHVHQANRENFYGNCTFKKLIAKGHTEKIKIYKNFAGFYKRKTRKILSTDRLR